MAKFWILKNIFKIHPLTYLVLISILLCGYFNYFLIIALILIVHDLGHLIMFKIYGYQILSIMILPFGSMINTNLNANAKTSELFLISLAGVSCQLLLYPIMALILNPLNYQIFLEYNQILIVFNLLPIIPLDGAKLMMALLEICFSYKTALKLLNLVSIITLIILLYYLAFNALNTYLIIGFLAYQTYQAIVKHQYLFNQFLLTRYLKKHSYRQLKYIDNIKQIFKNKYNFIKGKSEDKVLAAYFND